MRTVGLFEAKNKLSELVEAARAGEEIIITKRGAPVARLVPAPPAIRPADLAEALAALDARARARGTFTAAEIKSWIEEGRR